MNEREPEAPSSVRPPALTAATLAAAIQGQVLLAPLTRGGNLPYRRLCVEQGARITCSEMAHARLVAGGRRGEQALLRRGPSEPFFGVQLAGRQPDDLIRAAEAGVAAGADYIDINFGCPIDSVVRRGMGAGLLEKPKRLERLVSAVTRALAIPVTVKIRTGYRENRENAVEVAKAAEQAGAAAITVHGRTREQRYRRPANWEHIAEVAGSVAVPVIGNGDILTVADAHHRLATSGVAAVMLARGALIKPWFWADLADGRDRSRTGAERLVIMRRWVELAIDHWGGDEHGFARIRAFLEFHVDFWRRYVPAELIGHDAGMQERVAFEPRDDIERALVAESSDEACALILAPFGAPESALRPTGARVDASAGGWV